MTRLAFVLFAFGLATPTLATDQCIRVFSAKEPAGRLHFINPDDMIAFNAQLDRNNRSNRHVHSIAIFKDDSKQEITYTVLNGTGEPIYRGAQIHELAEAIDHATTTAGAKSVYVSLAGFSPKKAAGMQATMNMQWAHLDAKPKLVIRVPPSDQATIDIALPQEFFLPSSGIHKVTKVTTAERMTGPGNKKWYRVVVEFIVEINVTSKKIALRFMVRTRRMQQQLEQIMVTLRPDWLASHASAAEVVSQVMVQMKKANPKMHRDDFKVEILDQMDGNRFVEENSETGRPYGRHG
ncbi:hypothetical protein F2P45_18700 [Massilia sp. CCM 8733]|uniref:Secreted protein n=1 Tax=Massilia mucilaginosa TaxID=2609282 RepID=A0ABX0NX96_9BURK|nr:hypothetical protein [Massilia mucilaginosa]NHZ91032.1 hypothetical protein [Massilia mucilaginosa]